MELRVGDKHSGDFVSSEISWVGVAKSRRLVPPRVQRNRIVIIEKMNDATVCPRWGERAREPF